MKAIKRLKLYYAFYLIACLSPVVTMGQFPTIGSKLPNYTLTNVNHYRGGNLDISRFRGKWLILDFWNQYCGACISSFPAINKLQNQFNSNVQYILIGYTGSQYDGVTNDQSIRRLYKKYETRYKLKIATAFDSILFHKFDISACPYLIVIDPEGVVKAITNKINADDLSMFFSGNSPSLPRAYRRHEDAPKTTSLDSVFLSTNLDSPRLQISTILSKWKQGEPFNIRKMLTKNSLTSQAFYGTPLVDLYKYALLSYTTWSPIEGADSLYSKYWRYPILNVLDTSKFSYNFQDGVGLYNYFISTRKGISSDRQRQIMLQELNSAFSCSVHIEKKEMPCWKLIVKNPKSLKIKTSGGIPNTVVKSGVGVSIVNMPIRELITYIWIDNRDQPPIIDRTNIGYNVDINLDCVLTDINDIRRDLLKNGLDLIKSTEPFNVIVFCE